tara:strand:- start:666 stop:1157 length:492 start_codon:yes stop_codon:yes gene_type:complete
MTIILKNKQSLFFDDFNFKCCIGKKGLTENKIEGDKKTPKGIYSLGNLYYRGDKVKKPKTSLKCIRIKKNMGWCNDINNKFYNKEIKIKKKVKYEKLFRNDYKYDYLIPIKYNWRKPKKNKGSAIFIHLTRNYKPTVGCIALSLKDILILVKLIKKNTKIKII